MQFVMWAFFSALQGSLAIESLWMYAVSLVPESYLQKQISWYMRCERQATGKPFAPCLFFFYFNMTYIGRKGVWKIFIIHKKETNILLVTLAFLSHILFFFLKAFQDSFSPSICFPFPCAYLLLTLSNVLSHLS